MFQRSCARLGFRTASYCRCKLLLIRRYLRHDNVEYAFKKIVNRSAALNLRNEYCQTSEGSPPQVARTVKENSLSNQSAKPLILVVDDKRSFRALVCEFLQNAGYETVDAASAKDAPGLFLVSKSRVSALVTDMVLRGESGWSLAQRMRAQVPSLPIVFMSGYIDEATVARGHCAWRCCVLAKTLIFASID